MPSPDAPDCSSKRAVSTTTADVDDTALVVDVTELAKLVHEIIHARARRADQLRQCFLIDVSDDIVYPAVVRPCCDLPTAQARAPTAFAGIE